MQIIRQPLSRSAMARAFEEGPVGVAFSYSVNVDGVSRFQMPGARETAARRSPTPFFRT
jgi:hypothetical protein